MKLVGIIIAFNPEISKLISNVESIITDVDQLLIYKNSIIENEEYFQNKFGKKILFLGNENNVGIGKALNQGVNWAKENGYTHLLTLDQDSYFKNGHLANFRKIIEFQKSNINIGIFIPNLVYKNQLLLCGNDQPYFVLDGITSGSIFPLIIFDKVDGFNNYLFVDCVDYEFCYRIKYQYGLNTLLIPNVHLVHELGYSTKSVLGFTTLNYNSIRTFYLVRNHIMLWKKYPNLYRQDYKITLIKEYILFRFFKVLFSEKNKWNKVKSILKGIFHGLTNSL
jgi:rhamnosyltransferase